MTGGNIAAEFHAAAIGRLDAPFLLDGQRSWTYGEFFDQVRVYAAVLIDAGAQPGDRVLVQVEKSPEAVALYLACLWAGAVHVPLNPAFTTDERRYFIDDAEPAVIVVDPSVAEEPTWLTLDPDGAGSLTRRATAVAPVTEPVERSDGDLAAILYTSGTTGRPKGAALTHEGLRANAHALH
ncbi:MAG: AMP-binding protein, partial [Acidimicrobiaceae bacterium]